MIALTGFFVGKIVIKLKRKTIAAAHTLGAVGLLIGFLGNSVVLICVRAFITGVGFCMFASTANFHVSEMSTPSTLTFSLAFLSAIINLGQAFSPVVVNLISSMIGPDTGSRFIMAGIGSIAIAVLALLFVRNKSSHEEIRTAVVQKGN